VIKKVKKASFEQKIFIIQIIIIIALPRMPIAVYNAMHFANLGKRTKYCNISRCTTYKNSRSIKGKDKKNELVAAKY